MTNDSSDTITPVVVWAVVVLALIGVVGAVIVQVVTPGDASHFVLTNIVGFVGPTMAALIALLSKVILNRVRGLENKINGRLDQLLETRSRLERVIGRHEGTQAGQAVAIVDSADEAIWSKDIYGHILAWNKAAEELLGWNAVEVLGRSILDITPDYDKDKENNIMELIHRGEILERVQIHRLHKDGHSMEISSRIMPVRDIHGNVIAVASMSRPVVAGNQ